MKTKKYFIATICLAIFGLQACMTEEEMKVVTGGGTPPTGEKTAVVFTATNGSGPVTRTTNGGDEWVDGDSVGIYMAAFIDPIALSIADNRLFRARNVAQNLADLLPDHPDETMYYIDGDSLWFKAYYPYLESAAGGIMDYIFPVNVSNQADTTHIDLLYAHETNSGNGFQRASITAPVVLHFDHQLSKIVINVKRDQSGISVPLSALINDMPLTATFDLATGTLGNLSTPKPLQMLAMVDHPAGYDTTFQAIIIPDTIEANSKVIRILTERRQFSWSIPSRPIGSEIIPDNKFLPGYKYTFNLTLQGDESVQFEAEITKWTDWTAPPGSDPNLLTPDTTQAATGTVYSIPVGYIAAERRYADTIQTVFIHPTKPFMMGTTYNVLVNGNALPATPVHKVSLTNAYLIGQTEVTQSQYIRFLTDIGATSTSPTLPAALLAKLTALVPAYPTGPTNLGGAGVSYTGGKWTAANPNQPAAAVTWHGAMAYSVWAGGRLPTEAEWEYAARDTISFPGNFLNGTTNGAGMKGTYVITGTATKDVKTTTPSSWGLYDMIGNVWEWSFDRIVAVGGYPADAQPRTNPVGTSDEATASTLGIMRGGGTEAENILSIGSTRLPQPLGTPASGLGFRIVIQLR